jgi:mRNA interferase RelE/StbE
MAYTVVYTKRAVKAFKEMPRDTSNAIRQKIELNAASPYSTHRNVKKLQGREGYRLRYCDWRIIYEIQQEQIIILILDVGLRKEVYK